MLSITSPRQTQLGSKHTYQYRVSFIKVNYSNLLVLSHPMPGACVHAIDSRLPVFSTADSALIILLASRLRIENILLEKVIPTPYPPIFGDELSPSLVL